MTLYHLERRTKHNQNYRRVIYTDNKIQIVLMTLMEGEYIPLETHRHTSQFFRVESGKMRVILDKNGRSKTTLLKDGDAIVVPPNTPHFIQQVGAKPLKLYTIYSPPEHPVGRLNKRQPK